MTPAATEFPPTRRSPAWLVGITFLPFGLFSGFYAVAVPLLLTARGVSLDRVAAITAVVLIPSFTSFLLTPLVDCGMARRTWALLWAGVAALSLGAAVLLMDRAAHGVSWPLTAVLFLGALAAQLYSSTMGGMTPNLVRLEDTAAVSAWLNIGNLSGVGVGGTLGILAVQKLGLYGGAAAVAAEIFVPSLLLLVIGREERRPRLVGETMRRLGSDLWAVSRTRAALLGLLIFITPAATFAAQNLFSGLGRDFHASDGAVTWITGIGSALLCGLGAAFGGWLGNRMDRRMLFVATGVVAAFASVGMALGPRSAEVFFAGTGFYYLMAGVNYAACSAAAFDILGVNNPLSATQYALLMAACNVAIEVVTVGDGRGYARFGARGLLLTDAAFSLVTGTVMLCVIARWGKPRETAAPAHAI